MNIFIILMLISMMAVLGVLIAGIIVMGRGGEADKKYANKLMQWRVYLQGLTLVFFLLAALTRGH